MGRVGAKSGKEESAYCPLYFQSAVIPYRHVDGDIEILMVTRKKGKGWTIPKGIIEQPLSACQSAEEEAWEEAGIRGFVCPDRMGEYHYRKWGGVCHVRVFAMRVDRFEDSFPEDKIRQRKWVPVSVAVSLSGKKELRTALVDAIPKIRSFRKPCDLQAPASSPSGPWP